MVALNRAIEDWMVNYKKNSVHSATYDRLLTSLSLMRKYPISEIPVDMLGTTDIQVYLNQLVSDGYALSTIKKQYHLLSAYIGFANLMGILPRPIHKGVNLPSETNVRKQRKDVVAYTEEEQEALMRVFRSGESPAYDAAILMLETGMRVGEVLALTWSDVDWRRKAIRISKTVVHLGNGKKTFVQNGAKSYTSNRTIPLSSAAIDLLRRLRDADSSGSPLIFHKKNGDYITFATLRWWINKACDIAGVKYYGQHVFRHTFATNCYHRGCDVKVLSKLLGHSDVTITYNLYIHLFGDALEEMRQVIG